MAECDEFDEDYPRLRCGVRRAADIWAEVDALSDAAERPDQRFRPPRPERRPCSRFLATGSCPFGDACTHSHAIGGSPSAAHAGKTDSPPCVALHKLADRKVGRGTESMLLQTLATGGFSREPVPLERADLLLTNSFPSTLLLSKLRPGCVVNHFPGEQELGAKDRLSRLLLGLGLCPTTFLLPEESSLWHKAVLADLAAGDLWIVKPRQQGEGRHVEVLRAADLQARLLETGCAAPSLRSAVVSRYIANPLMVNGCKADLRVYVLVTRVVPALEAFIFREGLVRICGEPYDISDEGLQRVEAHISNNAIQTKAARHAAALNWTLSQLWESLDAAAEGPRSAAVWARIRRLVRDALEVWRYRGVEAVCRTSAAFGHSQCYSLMAFDLLVDVRGGVWLLEVNTKPALHTQSTSLKAVFPVHFKVKAPLLADVFNSVGLPLVAGGPRTPRPVLSSTGDMLGFEVLVPSAAQPLLRLALGVATVASRIFLDRVWLPEAMG